MAWEPSDADKLAKLSGIADAQPGEVGSEGFGPTFPHDPQKTPKPAKALLAMPVGNEGAGVVVQAGASAEAQAAISDHEDRPHF